MHVKWKDSRGSWLVSFDLNSLDWLMIHVLCNTSMSSAGPNVRRIKIGSSSKDVTDSKTTKHKPSTASPTLINHSLVWKDISSSVSVSWQMPAVLLLQQSLMMQIETNKKQVLLLSDAETVHKHFLTVQLETWTCGRKLMENQSNRTPAQSSCWSRVICLSRDKWISCLEEEREAMTTMTVLSLAYEGGGVSARQHLALHPLRPPLLRPSSLFFQWSQRTERKALLRSPDRLETESSWLLNFSPLLNPMKNKTWKAITSYLQTDESLSVLGLSVVLPAVEDEAVWFVPLASPVLPARGGLWRHRQRHKQSNKQ